MRQEVVALSFTLAAILGQYPKPTNDTAALVVDDPASDNQRALPDSSPLRINLRRRRDLPRQKRTHIPILGRRTREGRRPHLENRRSVP
jgi:hypothetical protein